MKSNVSSASVRVLRSGVFAALVAGLSGCAHSVHHVKVDAIQNPDVQAGYAYRIVDKTVARGGLDACHDEAISAVKAALEARGMYEAPDPARAEVEVLVDYGVGPRRLKIQNYERGMVPTLARAPLAILPLRQPNGAISLAAVSADQLDMDGTLHGVPVLRGSHVFEKFLLISARETEHATGPTRKPAEAWQVQVTVEDATDTLDGYLLVLAGAAAEYLGASTDERQHVRLRGSEATVALAKSTR